MNTPKLPYRAVYSVTPPLLGPRSLRKRFGISARQWKKAERILRKSVSSVHGMWAPSWRYQLSELCRQVKDGLISEQEAHRKAAHPLSFTKVKGSA